MPGATSGALVCGFGLVDGVAKRFCFFGIRQFRLKRSEGLQVPVSKFAQNRKCLGQGRALWIAFVRVFQFVHALCDCFRIMPEQLSSSPFWKRAPLSLFFFCLFLIFFISRLISRFITWLIYRSGVASDCIDAPVSDLHENFNASIGRLCFANVIVFFFGQIVARYLCCRSHTRNRSTDVMIDQDEMA